MPPSPASTAGSLHAVPSHPIRNVAVIAPDRVSPFELSVAAEVFGIDRSAQGLPLYDFAVCRTQRGPVTTQSGFGIVTPHGLERVEEADLVIVPSWADTDLAPDRRLIRTLWQAVDRGSIVASFCSGAFALAHAGLLDGRRATTHHMYADALAKRFPKIDVDPAVLYVIDRPIMTSAGSSAAIDLCLHIVRENDGSDVATALARRMVVPPQREGGQAQFINHPVPPSAEEERLATLMDWMIEHLEEDLTVDELAARVHMAPRTFARRFREETGTTPHHWLTAQRVHHAQRLLERTDNDIDHIASLCGFGSAATLRHHFARRVGTSPMSYRRTFQVRSA